MAVAISTIERNKTASTISCCSDEQLFDTRELVRFALNDPSSFDIITSEDRRFLSYLYNCLSFVQKKGLRPLRKWSDHIIEAANLAKRWHKIYTDGWPAEQLPIVEDIMYGGKILVLPKERAIFQSYFLKGCDCSEVATQFGIDLINVDKEVLSITEKIEAAYIIRNDCTFGRRQGSDKERVMPPIALKTIRKNVKAARLLCQKFGLLLTLPLPEELAVELSEMIEGLKLNAKKAIIFKAEGMSNSEVAAKLKGGSEVSNKDLQFVQYHLAMAEDYSRKWLQLRTNGFPVDQREVLIEACSRLKSKSRNAFWLSIIEHRTTTEIASLLDISEPSVLTEYNRALEFFAKHYITDQNGLPTEKKLTPVKALGCKGCPERHLVLNNIVKLAKKHRGKFPCSELKELAYEMYPNSERIAAYMNLWAHVTKLLGSGHLRREQIEGVEYYIPVEATLAEQKPPKKNPPRGFPAGVIDYTWIKREHIPEFLLGAWRYKSDVIIEMLRQLKKQNRFHPEKSCRISIMSLYRSAIARAWGIDQTNIDQNMLRVMTRYNSEVKIFIVDSRLTTSAKNTFHYLSQRGKSLFERI